MPAARAVWIIANGDPGEDAYVLHKRICNGGSGAHGCININHLYLGDLAQNQADRNDSGTGNGGERNGMARLTDAQVQEIRRRYARYAPSSDPNGSAALAAEFGVTQGRISRLAKGGIGDDRM